MTLEQKGCYMELLILQFNTEKFTEAQAKQVLSICFEVAWPVLKQKFILEDGFYFNDRLREEINKRRKFTESRRINGLAGKKPSKTPKKDGKHMHKHMEDENENENKSLDIIKGVEIKPEFLDIFSRWLEYKRKRGEAYKTKESAALAYKKLLKLADNDPKKAIEVIEDSMANNYAGLFKPKEQNGSKTNIDLNPRNANQDIASTVKFSTYGSAE